MRCSDFHWFAAGMSFTTGMWALKMGDVGFGIGMIAGSMALSGLNIAIRALSGADRRKSMDIEGER